MKGFLLRPKTTKLAQLVRAYQEYERNIAKVSRDFSSCTGLEADTFYPERLTVAFVPTRNDYMMYKPQLDKNAEPNKMSRFKFNSVCAQIWRFLLRENKIRIVYNQPDSYLAGLLLEEQICEVDGELYVSRDFVLSRYTPPLPAPKSITNDYWEIYKQFELLNHPENTIGY